MIKINLKRLEKAMIEKRLTASELSVLCGLSQATIYKVFKQEKAQMKTIRKIEKQLKIDLLGGDECIPDKRKN